MWKMWVLGATAVVLLGLGVFVVMSIRSNEESSITESTTEGSSLDDETGQIEETNDESGSASDITWQFSGSEWQASGTPPTCPSPVAFVTPVNVSSATAILYPGQTRGGNYKPHGGFRFDNSTDNQVSVVAPMSGVIVNGARYLVDGETQYTFDFIAPCGIMYRLGHLLELTPKFQAIAETFPAAKENDSRTTFVDPPVSVTAREEIATAIGIRTGTNTFVDWGVYDLRQKNSVASTAAWQALHADDLMLAPYAVCWFDMLPAADAATVKSLPPGDPTSGTKSDYCL